MTVSLALDVVIAGLLVATIAYCVVLNRRLRELRAGQGEFTRLIKSFDAAAERAGAGVARLRDVSNSSKDTLDGQFDAASALRDELAFLVENGSRLASRLGGNAPAARPRTAPVPVAPATAARTSAARPLAAFPDVAEDSPAAQGGEGSAVERDLLRALRVAREG